MKQIKYVLAGVIRVIIYCLVVAPCALISLIQMIGGASEDEMLLSLLLKKLDQTIEEIVGD